MITEVVESNGFGAEEDLLTAVALLDGAARGLLPARLYRGYRPARTVAFTMRERRLPGFAAAWGAAIDADFVPLLRRTGGRVAAYDRSCLIVDIIEPADTQLDHRESFGRVSAALCSALRRLNIDALIGPVPGEYCPGDFSVGARSVVKLVGISQRVSRGFRLVSSVIAVEPAPQIVDVLTEVNRELDFPWRPETCGSLLGENGGLTFESAESAIRSALVPGPTFARLDWRAERALHSFLLNDNS